MCNWLVTGTEGDGGATRSRPIDTEQEAKAIAHSWASLGTTNIEIWERKYSAATDIRTVLTAPNGRTEVYEPVSDSTGGNTGGDS